MFYDFVLIATHLLPTCCLSSLLVHLSLAANPAVTSRALFLLRSQRFASRLALLVRQAVKMPKKSPLSSTPSSHTLAYSLLFRYVGYSPCCCLLPLCHFSSSGLSPFSFVPPSVSFLCRAPSLSPSLSLSRACTCFQTLFSVFPSI